MSLCDDCKYKEGTIVSWDLKPVDLPKTNVPWWYSQKYYALCDVCLEIRQLKQKIQIEAETKKNLKRYKKQCEKLKQLKKRCI